jgi:hypothetical protein
LRPAGRWRMWLPRSVWANRCWRVGCASNARAASAGDNWRRCRTPMNTLSWIGYAVRAELCWPTHLLSDPEHVESQLSSRAASSEVFADGVQRCRRQSHASAGQNPGKHESAGWTLIPRKDFCSLSRLPYATKDICGNSAVLGQLIFRAATALSCDATD